MNTTQLKITTQSYRPNPLDSILKKSQPPSKDVKSEELIDLSRGIITTAEKLGEVEGEENVHVLLVDLWFYSNYFLTLGMHSWWGITSEQLNLLNLDDKVKENKQMRLDLFDSIRLYDLGLIGAPTLEEKLLVWKTQLVKNYSILMEAKSKPTGFISRINMAQFMRNIVYINFDLFSSSREYDLDDNEKHAIETSVHKLNFLRPFVQLAETEGMASLLNCILDYTCKVEVLLFGFWTRKLLFGGREDSLVSFLKQGDINVDEPCSILIILDVFKMSNTMLLAQGMPGWDYNGGEVIFRDIWESTLIYLPGIIDGAFILKYIPKLECGIQLLHECLAFLDDCVDALSSDMRVVFIRATTSLGFISTFCFRDLSEPVVIEQVKSHLSVLTTSLHICKTEVLLGKLLLSHHSTLIILVMTLHKELEDGLEFLRGCLTDNKDRYLDEKVLLMSQIEAVPCDTLSFLKLVGDHKVEEDACAEIDLAFFKLLGTTKLIQAHVLALEFLNCHREFLLEDQLVKLCDKLGFLVGLVKNFDANNVNQILFLLDTGAVATEVASIISLFGINMTDESLKEGTLRLLHLIDDIHLLEAELMLNIILNDHIELIVPCSNIEMLRNRLSLLRIILTNSIERNSGDKELVVSSAELVKDAISLVSKLFHNRSNKDMAMEMNDFVSDLLQTMNAWETNATAHYLQIRRSSLFTHSRTARLGFIDCLVNSLSDLSSYMPGFPWMKYQIGRTCKDLKSSRSLLKDLSWEDNEGDELNNLVSQLTRAAYEVEYIAESFVIRDGNTWNKRLWISDLIDEIKQISVEITVAFDKQSYKGNFLGTSSGVARVLLPVDTSSSNEVVVGFEKLEEKVINQLTGKEPEELGIVSIVGMGGFGKTTLARRVFKALSVQQRFDIRAWCYISKVYQKRKLLLELLGHIIEVTPEVQKKTDDQLANSLRQLLLRSKYLIVMDDVWDIGAWDELQKYFPKDSKGSRIMLTSRYNNIASETRYGLEPFSIGELSDRNSWELLEKKLFKVGHCPLQFRDVGWEIAVNCKGLPLAVVVISGLLSAKNKMNLDWWKQVAGNLKSIVVGNSKNFTDILDLSYHHLPDYLKPCFLYFGAFHEDKRILVSNLIDLWTTEGFIQRKDDKNLNDVARDYLQELVSRNLVTVAERTSMGGIKACYVHDLLHELCWARGEEENFLHVVKDLGNSSSSVSNALEYVHRRVCFYSEKRNLVELRPSGQCIRSLLYFARGLKGGVLQDYDVSFISVNFKLLKTLKLDSINIGDSLPDGFELLVNLRFLAVFGFMTSIPDSIKCLSYLEVFCMKGLRGEIMLPHSIWCLKKLRHLRVKNRFAFSSIKDILNELPQLDNLESLSTVFLPDDEASKEHMLRRLLSLKKLKCIFSESWNEIMNCNQFPSLNLLVQLESLKVLYHGRVRHPSVFSYPATLKKLTLSKFRLPWKDISAIGTLPCLEVLKLLFKAFEGQEWEVSDEEFKKLKYLKLDSLDIVRWTTTYASFPCLEQIVLQSCKKLEEVPITFGERSTLKMVQVQWCSKTVANSVRDIQAEQKEELSKNLNVRIHPPGF